MELLIGLLLGIVSWEIGRVIMVRMQKKRGCFDVCYHCGKPPFEESK